MFSLSSPNGSVLYLYSGLHWEFSSLRFTEAVSVSTKLATRTSKKVHILTFSSNVVSLWVSCQHTVLEGKTFFFVKYLALFAKKLCKCL